MARLVVVLNFVANLAALWLATLPSTASGFHLSRPIHTAYRQRLSVSCADTELLADAGRGVDPATFDLHDEGSISQAAKRAKPASKKKPAEKKARKKKEEVKAVDSLNSIKGKKSDAGASVVEEVGLVYSDENGTYDVPIVPVPMWYKMIVLKGKEKNVVKDFMDMKKENKRWGKIIDDAYTAQEKKVRYNSKGKLVANPRPSMPGIVYIRCTMDPDIADEIEDVEFVGYLMKTGSVVVPLSAEEEGNLIKRREIEDLKLSKDEKLMSKDDYVRVVRGAMEGRLVHTIRFHISSAVHDKFMLYVTSHRSLFVVMCRYGILTGSAQDGSLEVQFRSSDADDERMDMNTKKLVNMVRFIAPDDLVYLEDPPETRWKDMTAKAAVEKLMRDNPNDGMLRALRRSGQLQSILYGEDDEDSDFGSRKSSEDSERFGREGGKRVRSIAVDSKGKDKKDSFSDAFGSTGASAGGNDDAFLNDFLDSLDLEGGVDSGDNSASVEEKSVSSSNFNANLNALLDEDNNEEDASTGVTVGDTTMSVEDAKFIGVQSNLAARTSGNSGFGVDFDFQMDDVLGEVSDWLPRKRSYREMDRIEKDKERIAKEREMYGSEYTPTPRVGGDFSRSERSFDDNDYRRDPYANRDRDQSDGGFRSGRGDRDRDRDFGDRDGGEGGAKWSSFSRDKEINPYGDASDRAYDRPPKSEKVRSWTPKNSDSVGGYGESDDFSKELDDIFGKSDNDNYIPKSRSQGMSGWGNSKQSSRTSSDDDDDFGKELEEIFGTSDRGSSRSQGAKSWSQMKQMNDLDDDAGFSKQLDDLFGDSTTKNERKEKPRASASSSDDIDSFLDDLLGSEGGESRNSGERVGGDRGLQNDSQYSYPRREETPASGRVKWNVNPENRNRYSKNERNKPRSDDQSSYGGGDGESFGKPWSRDGPASRSGGASGGASGYNTKGIPKGDSNNAMLDDLFKSLGIDDDFEQLGDSVSAGEKDAGSMGSTGNSELDDEWSKLSAALNGGDAMPDADSAGGEDDFDVDSIFNEIYRGRKTGQINKGPNGNRRTRAQLENVNPTSKKIPGDLEVDSFEDFLAELGSSSAGTPQNAGSSQSTGAAEPKVEDFANFEDYLNALVVHAKQDGPSWSSQQKGRGGKSKGPVKGPKSTDRSVSKRQTSEFSFDDFDESSIPPGETVAFGSPSGTSFDDLKTLGIESKKVADVQVARNDNQGSNKPSSKPSTDFSGLKVADLKVLCKEQGLPVSGTKSELIKRLGG
jgi:transcription antitermination factor NusG/ribosomal protein L25 (general stress protein Ctc)